MKVGRIKLSRFKEGLIVFKPDYYLNQGKKVISDLLDISANHSSLADVCENIFQGGIFKRVFVEDAKFGLKYITASDMMKSEPLNTAKNISQRYTPWIDRMKLQKDQILMSCAGTVGNTALVSESFSHCIGSQEIIRIEPSNIGIGYLYAYLKADTVNQYIQSMVYGAVIPRISPAEIGKLPVLLPSESIQIEINNLIEKSSNLRSEASSNLNDAILYFEDKINVSQSNLGYRTGIVQSNTLNQFHKRLDGQYQLIWKDLYNERPANYSYQNINSLAKKIFVGGRGKRIYVEKGVHFLSSSEMMLYNPKRNCKKVSRRTAGLESMIVSKKDILISRSGSVGNTVIIGEELNKTAISEHALRLIIDPEKISPNYVFCFLRTKYGINSMEASSFGSVIITLNEELIGDIDIPILSKEDQDKISELIENYITKMDESVALENEALDLVENEIEQWQK